MLSTANLPHQLRDDIVATGYFPEFIQATVARSLGGEQVASSVVHHEATFNRDALHRHVTVLVLTDTRLIVSHTDDGETPGVPQALTTVESVPLRKIRSVGLTQVVNHPERFAHHIDIAEVWLTVAWGVMRRIETEPATCPDPTCDADHGFTSADAADDLVVRMSAAAHGSEGLEQLLTFGTQLQLKTNR